jgi:CBS domain-containing protein
MKVDRVYTRKVMATTRSASLAEAAAAMRRYRVGSLLVLEDGGGGHPVGIVTDRDLALEGFAAESCTAGAAMTPVIATVGADADLHEALDLMRAHGVRRLVVTAAEGDIVGILSIDDIVDGLSTDLAAAAAVLKGEGKRAPAGLAEVVLGS